MKAATGWTSAKIERNIIRLFTVPREPRYAATISPSPVRSSCLRARHQRRPGRRRQSLYLGRLLPRLFRTPPRLRKGDRPSPHHHTRPFARRLAGSDPGADVAIMDGAGADFLIAHNLVRPDSKMPLAESFIGMVVRAGQPKPDISTVDALRKTLLDAKSIAYSDSSSGTYLSTVGFKKLGIAEAVAGKSRKVRGPPSGEPVAAVVARGEAELGFQQVAELINVPV